MDPLFKKASADFDEGGAKGLLLNHLSIDGQGRIVFDSSDDVADENANEAGNAGQESADPEQPSSPSPTPQQPANDTFEENTEIDIAPLANRFFPDLDRLGEQDICPSLKNLDLGDPSGSLDIPFLKAPEDWRHDKSNEEGHNANDASGIMLDDDNAVGFDDDDATLAGFDLSGDTGFGDGGEAWARDAALEPMLKVRVDRDGDDNNEEDIDNDDAYVVSLSHQSGHRDHENILSYFDNALQKNWAGPEHWKIRRIKENTAASTTNAGPKQRKEKEPFEIDFSAPLEPAVAESIYTPAASNSAISLPKTQWKTKGRNLLPDDKHFNSRQLLRLFLKPKARMGSKKLQGIGRFNHRRQDRTPGNGEMDEAFWANHKSEDNTHSDEVGAQGAYDANFFADDDGLAFPNGLGLGDDEDDNLPFADAREMLSPPTDGRPGTSAGEGGGAAGLSALLNMVGATPGSALQSGGFGSQLVTQGGRRARPDYVGYARVAKKVDVRRLKQEMWKGMGNRLIESTEFDSTLPTQPEMPLPTEPCEDMASEPPTPTPVVKSPEPVSNPDGQKDNGRLRFTQIMNSLKAVYPPETLRDISTSFGFICLLHLANEQGLILESDSLTQGGDTLEEIFVARDINAVIEEGAI